MAHDYIKDSTLGKGDIESFVITEGNRAHDTFSVVHGNVQIFCRVLGSFQPPTDTNAKLVSRPTTT
jgi:hypothetical protein